MPAIYLFHVITAKEINTVVQGQSLTRNDKCRLGANMHRDARLYWSILSLDMLAVLTLRLQNSLPNLLLRKIRKSEFGKQCWMITPRGLAWILWNKKSTNAMEIWNNHRIAKDKHDSTSHSPRANPRSCGRGLTPWLEGGYKRGG